MWRISKEIESIVYAVDINHATERHLNPTLLNTLKKPALMICGVRNPVHLKDSINIIGDRSKKQNRTNIEQNIMSTVLATLRNGGDVLFPTDSTMRLLELLLFFDQEWGRLKCGKGAYRIALLHNNGFHVIDFANLLMSWMSSSVTDSFDENRTKAFDLKYIEIVRTKQELEELPSPKVVFATSQSMDYGFAHDIIGETKFSSNPNNLVIVTNKPSPNPKSISNILTESIKTSGGTSPITIEPFLNYTREKISGQQLLDWENAKKRAEAEQAALELKKEAEAQLLEFSAEEVVNSEEKSTNDSFQIDLKQFGQYAKPIHPMFDFKVKPIQFDEYGEVLDQNALSHYTKKFTSVDVLDQNTQGEQQANDNSKTDTSNQNGAKHENNQRESDDEEDDEEAQRKEAIPTVMREEPLEGGLLLKCQVKYAPLLGLANHRSCGILIRQVSPKKLILIGTGTDTGISSSDKMSKVASTILSSSGFDSGKDVNVNVFIPTNDPRDMVKISADSQYFETVVDDELLRGMRISSLGSYEIGILDAIYSDADKSKSKTAAAASDSKQLALSKAPEEVKIGKGGIDIDEIVSKPTTIVGLGDLRLLDMRNELAEKLGVQTEIREGGVLRTEKGISITKHGPNDYSIEGPVCDLYYKVRALVYKHFAFV